MSDYDTSVTVSGPAWPWMKQSRQGGKDLLALVIAWSASEPHRMGEIAFIPDDGSVQGMGRGAPRPDDPQPKLSFYRQRPDGLEPAGPIAGKGISRNQLSLRDEGQGLRVERTGRCQVYVNGRHTEAGLARPGDVLTLQHHLVMLVVRRSSLLTPLKSYDQPTRFRFGGPDPHGIVGESPAAWALRDQLAFAAHSDTHTLILGETGVGKELAAGAIHQMSRRGGGSNGRPMVSRNAATLPPGLIDAELFGNVRDYPNPGMRDRKGLIGESDGSTLFLDEIGELPSELQAHLLRVLDSGGEYQRLGEGELRRADFRLVAATNRDLDDLKHDFAARLKLRVRLPGLDERREDVPLIARALLERAAQRNPELGKRFFEGWGQPGAYPRVDPTLIEALLRQRYSAHVREIEGLLWTAMSASSNDYIAMGDEVRRDLVLVEEPTRDPTELDADAIRVALEKANQNVTQAARDLGLKNRYALYRLMKKLGVDSTEGE